MARITKDRAVTLKTLAYLLRGMTSDCPHGGQDDLLRQQPEIYRFYPEI